MGKLLDLLSEENEKVFHLCIVRLFACCAERMLLANYICSANSVHRSSVDLDCIFNRLDAYTDDFSGVGN